MIHQKPEIPSSLLNRKIPWGPIGKAVYQRTYSHEFEDKTKETWAHTVCRAVDGNLGLVSPRYIEDGEREKLIDFLMNFSILPGGRHLYASGIKGRQYLSNCHVSGYKESDPTRHFTFLFDQLMMGGGVGANYSNRYIQKIPSVTASLDLHITCRPDHPDLHEFQDLLSKHNSIFDSSPEVFTVEDSREGWTVALGHVLSGIFGTVKGEKTVIIDVSRIRRRGTPLVTSGGIACGPGPLVQMLTNVTKVINGCVGSKLRSLDVMLIDHYLADCVVAGGKRRSSRMSVKSWRDPDIFEFLNCKHIDGAHWTTNISVEVDDEFFPAYYSGDKHAKDVARQVTLGMRLNGEPGYWNRSLSSVGESGEDVYCPNPCGEIILNEWENCNLGALNLGALWNKPEATIKEGMRLLTRWLLRATNGDMPHEEQSAVVGKNRRIGAGLMGFHEFIALRYGIKYSDVADSVAVRALLFELKKTSVEEAGKYAKQMEVPVPIKHTCIAPTGTTALLPGTTSAIQCMMAPWFKRLVRYASDDPELRIKKSEGYESFVDEDAKNTEYIVYWCEDPLVAKARANGFDPGILEGQSDIPFETSLRIQKMVQECFADNAISFTVNLEPDRMPPEEEMERCIVQHLKGLKGTTVFPNKSRRNNPIQPVTKAQFDAYTGPKEIAQIEDECKGACPIK